MVYIILSKFICILANFLIFVNADSRNLQETELASNNYQDLTNLRSKHIA